MNTQKYPKFRELYLYQNGSKTETDLVQFVGGEVTAWFVATDDYETHPDGWRPVAVDDVQALEPLKYLTAELHIAHKEA